jgi:ethanolamine utilization protein EutQ (cupin superfamily)
MTLPPDSIDLTNYSAADLNVLRERILALLPMNLASVDLEEELMAQLISAKALMADSSDAPLNQRAQASNTITAILKQLVDLQMSVTTTETIKRMERILLKTLQDHPTLQEAFMVDYEEALNAKG